jgi:hypothetical protein
MIALASFWEVEPVFIQAFIPELAVEALDEPVLHPFAGLNGGQLYSRSLGI